MPAFVVRQDPARHEYGANAKLTRRCGAFRVEAAGRAHRGAAERKDYGWGAAVEESVELRRHDVGTVVEHKPGASLGVGQSA